MNLYLIGFRCTGKTTVGRLLARRLEWPFVDTDEEIVRQAGRSVLQIVRQEGWDRFREMESEAVRIVTSADRQVVATGGGVVLREQNAQRMRDTGVIVWLRATPETIRDRILLDLNSIGQRPGLTVQGPHDEVEGVLTERIPVYESVTSFHVDTDDRSPEKVCEIILEEL
jgi:shikimate kinase